MVELSGVELLDHIKRIAHLKQYTISVMSPEGAYRLTAVATDPGHIDPE